MMTTQTQTGAYLKKMAQGGHFKQKLGETALALTECYCKADGGNRADLGEQLVSQLFKVLREVYGWDHNSCVQAATQMAESFRRTEYNE